MFDYFHQVAAGFVYELFDAGQGSIQFVYQTLSAGNICVPAGNKDNDSSESVPCS